MSRAVSSVQVLLADNQGWLMTYSLEAERIINRQQVMLLTLH